MDPYGEETAGLSPLSSGVPARGVLFLLAEPPAKPALDTLPASVLGSLPEAAATVPVAACCVHPSSLPAGQAEPHVLSGKISAG